MLNTYQVIFYLLFFIMICILNIKGYEFVILSIITLKLIYLIIYEK